MDTPNADSVVAPLCSTAGHEAVLAVAEVVLGDCDEGSCLGHPYCRECVEALRSDSYNTVIDEPPSPPEVPDIIHIEEASTSDALRELARRFEADEDLVLIGLWNIEPPEDWMGATRLQVVVTHMEPS